MPPTLGKHDYKDKMTLRAGTSAVLELPFTASPQPDVAWKFKGGRMPDSRRFKDETIIGMTSLTMKQVTKTDAGDYSLSLENPFGKATFTIKLIVLGEYQNIAIIVKIMLMYFKEVLIVKQKII